MKKVSNGFECNITCIYVVHYYIAITINNQNIVHRILYMKFITVTNAHMGYQIENLYLHYYFDTYVVQCRNEKFWEGEAVISQCSACIQILAF